MEKEDEEGGAPGDTVGHETMKQGRDGDGEDYAANCPAHPGHEMTNQEEEEEDEMADQEEEDEMTNQEEDEEEEEDDDEEEEDDDDGGSPVSSTVSASDRETLMRERKLILILDLDLTLLNSTKVDDVSPDEQANGLTRHAEGNPAAGLFRVASDRYFVKLRPFVRDFLEQASSMFEMHVYTLGIRSYARAAVELLDPDGVYFGDRVVSRDESTQDDTKSLDVIHGADPDMVVILDDTDDVWPEHQRNLILMFRYCYFASTNRDFGYVDDFPSLSEQGLDERGHGGWLAVVLGVLKRVHQGFFDGDRADVREVIAEVRRQVLHGCTVAFGSCLRQDDMEEFTWELAEALGAVCRRDVDETVTHVVAEDPGNEMARWARDNGKFLVDPGWVMAANFGWRRPKEQVFPVNFRE